MEELVHGIHHFQQNIFRSQQELFEKLAHGQDPEVLFITCSDSRINPNLITQTLPGEMFVLRNAGNIVPPYGAANGGEGATIEYAVAVLEVEDIIICGHSHCGAMKAVLDPSQLDELPAVRNWLGYAESTRRIMREKYRDLRDEPLLTATVEENVLVQLENLKTHPSVAVRLAQGRLKLHGWVYEIETGRFFAYHPDQDEFLALDECPPQPAVDPARLGRIRSI